MSLGYQLIVSGIRPTSDPIAVCSVEMFGTKPSSPAFRMASNKLHTDRISGGSDFVLNNLPQKKLIN